MSETTSVIIMINVGTERMLYLSAEFISPFSKDETPRVIPSEGQYFPSVHLQGERFTEFSRMFIGTKQRKIKITRKMYNLYLESRLIRFFNSFKKILPSFLPIQCLQICAW